MALPIDERLEEITDSAGNRIQSIRRIALLLAVCFLLGFCVSELIHEKKTKAIYEELQERVKHIADDLQALKEDVDGIIKQKNEFNVEWMEGWPVGKDDELRGEEAGWKLKGHETAHEVRKRFQSNSSFFVCVWLICLCDGWFVTNSRRPEFQMPQGH